jgi:hypothetical protein
MFRPGLSVVENAVYAVKKKNSETLWNQVLRGMKNALPPRLLWLDARH